MKFSVIIINYNHADVLGRCIESALKQTYENVEIICVDDCSTDGSLQIMQTYADKFENVRIVKHDTNLGPHCARIDGIKCATGDYVLFVDSDDALIENCCEVLHNALSKNAYDVVCFDTKLEFSEDTTQDQREDAPRYFKHRRLGELRGDDILEAAFIDHDFPHAVWNKCYHRNLLLAAAEELVYEPLFMSEDYYMSFVILSKAQSFLGIPDKLYRYSFGGGISTAQTLSFRRFEMILTGCAANHHCTAYAEASPARLGRYREVLMQNKTESLYGAYIKAKSLPINERAQAVELIARTFGVNYTITTLANHFWQDGQILAEMLDIGKLCPVTRKEIKTVGMYYHRMYNGGVERVISLLTPILMDMGYRVVMITDVPENEMDYPLPADVPRVALAPDASYDGLHYTYREQKLTEAIETYQIDAVIYHAWVDKCLFWDMSIIKSAGAAFIIHCHGGFTSGLADGWLIVQEAEPAFRHADAVCTLSRTDRHYWSRHNPKVFQVQNPNTLTEHPPTMRKERPENILWVTRFTPDKNPEDVIAIMEQVVARVPYAKINMVGQVSDELKAALTAAAKEKGIEHNVSLPGFSSNVGEYYEKADVFLSTSNSEGAPMTFAESFAYHVPIVTYELPYLVIMENTEGIVSVPWKDTTAAAEAISYLLLHPEELQRRSESAGKKFREMAAYDYQSIWSAVLDAALMPKASAAISGEISEEDFSVFVETVNLVSRQLAWQIPRIKEYCIQNAQQEIYNSRRYKVGKAVLWLPSKVVAAVRLLKTKGIGYTIKFALGRAMGKSTDELLEEKARWSRGS